MPEQLSKDVETLDGLRREIDEVDAEMHRLLIRRGEVIERLIAAKRTAPTASAFRPDREAAMLARFAARHRGPLPLATVEHIWREIIGTFTQLQAPFRVHAVDAGAPLMRDLLRFQFGFSAPLVEQASPAAVISAIGLSATDLGVVPLDGWDGSAWWRALGTGPGHVKVIALLPFLTSSEGWPPSLVLGPSAISNCAEAVSLHAATVRGAAVPGTLSGDAEILAVAEEQVLVGGRGDVQSLVNAARGAGLKLSDLQVVGSYCTPPAGVAKQP